MSNAPRTSAQTFGYVFPAIRGVQAKHEYFVSMCPMRLIPRIFLFNEDDLVPELRAQRVLNKARVPEIARYIVQNRDSYVFSAITASVDGHVRFEPVGDSPAESKLGSLHVSMDAKFVINDGQHRRAAIEQAMRDCPDIADESIAVVFFVDSGLSQCQQMFADLNRHAIRPSTSLGVLYDHRDDDARLVKLSMLKIPLFRDLTEMERSTLSARSRKLFTLSALYSANNALLAKMDDVPVETRQALATSFWEEVVKQFPDWRAVYDRKLNASEVRSDFLHSHGIVLQALGRVGNTLLRSDSDNWQKAVRKLSRINWGRSNSRLWEGRAIVGGKVSKSTTNVVLTTNAIKKALNLDLSPEERRVEDAHERGEYVDATGV